MTPDVASHGRTGSIAVEHAVQDASFDVRGPVPLEDFTVSALGQ